MPHRSESTRRRSTWRPRRQKEALLKRRGARAAESWKCAREHLSFFIGVAPRSLDTQVGGSRQRGGRRRTARRWSDVRPRDHDVVVPLLGGRENAAIAMKTEPDTIDLQAGRLTQAQVGEVGNERPVEPECDATVS